MKNEIYYVKDRGELKKFRMCARDEYNRAIQLINTAKKIGKNPGNKNVQIWLAKQTELTLDEVESLILKYYQAQLIDAQINDAEIEEESSIFETEAVRNNILNPEENLFRIENIIDDLENIEKEFENCQTRQKRWLNTFISLRILQVLETKLLKKQIIELLENRNFIDQNLLQNFNVSNTLPEQAELAKEIGKDEGSVSNTIKTFFEKVQSKISIS